MPIHLYIATTNPGKLRDFQVAAAAYAADFLIEPLPNLDQIPAPPENGETFFENACSKAIYYSHFAAACIVLADDSGLEVDALDGAPGVRSARYAQDAGFRTDATATTVDQRNNYFLMKNLGDLAPDTRTARYRCILAAAQKGEILTSAEGTVAGRILEAPSGTGGFGYDPLFFLPGENCTMAELDLETKHRLSHRGNALRTLLPKLMT